jgi:hypothetical protein
MWNVSNEEAGVSALLSFSTEFPEVHHTDVRDILPVYSECTFSDRWKMKH